MKTMLMMASVLAIAGTTACQKDQPDTQTPATATAYEEEEATTGTPTARETGKPVGGLDDTDSETTISGQGEIEGDTLGEDLDQPSDTTLAGRTPMPKAEAMAVQEVVAVFAPMQGSKIAGNIRVKETASGLELDANLNALPQGDVTLIVHTNGDCSSADGSSAGEAFDLGVTATTATGKGSLALVRADKSGRATARETFQGASLHGERSLVGRSVMIHETAASATGGLGRPLACAVFGIAREYESGATR